MAAGARIGGAPDSPERKSGYPRAPLMYAAVR
jgi:hypothetical protein